MKPEIMPARKLGVYRKMLVAKKMELLSELRRSLADLVAQEEREDDLAVSHYRFVSERLANLDCKELELVEEALGRLQAGTYGTCEECGRLIAQLRLEAVPWAVRCRACEEHTEARPAVLAGAA